MNEKIGTSIEFEYYADEKGLLYPKLEITDKKYDKPLGRYGRMAVDYMEEHYPSRLTFLKIDCTYMEVFHKANEKVLDRIYELLDEQLKTNPVPKTANILERTRHINNLKSIAEEFAIEEVVFTYH